MSAVSASTRKPLGTISESVLNSPEREYRKKNLKTPFSSQKSNQKKQTPVSNYKDIIIVEEKRGHKNTPPVAAVTSSPKRSEGSKSRLHRSSDNITEVKFPPGNMGLDLEPLISSVSPERLIGCKVKDFYFGIDHTGITEAEAKSLICPGDILSSINGKEVLFVQFMDILNMLRGLKAEERSVCFKRLSSDDSKLYDPHLFACIDINSYLIHNQVKQSVSIALQLMVLLYYHLIMTPLDCLCSPQRNGTLRLYLQVLDFVPHLQPRRWLRLHRAQRISSYLRQ